MKRFVMGQFRCKVAKFFASIRFKLFGDKEGCFSYWAPSVTQTCLKPSFDGKLVCDVFQKKIKILVMNTENEHCSQYGGAGECPLNCLFI